MGVEPIPTGTTSSEAGPMTHRDKGDPELEMDQDPPGQVNPGPQFARSDIIVCDVEEFDLQKGLVTCRPPQLCDLPG